MFYYLNTTAEYGGENHVHTDACIELTKVSNKKFLGNFTSKDSAIAEAKKIGFDKAVGCPSCCK